MHTTCPGFPCGPTFLSGVQQHTDHLLLCPNPGNFPLSSFLFLNWTKTEERLQAPAMVNLTPWRINKMRHMLLEADSTGQLRSAICGDFVAGRPVIFYGSKGTFCSRSM